MLVSTSKIQYGCLTHKKVLIATRINFYLHQFELKSVDQTTLVKTQQVCLDAKNVFKLLFN